MKKFSIILTLLILLSSLNAFAQTPPPSEINHTKHILLKDGTKIKGEITGFTNNTFTVQSSVLGPVQIKDTDVISITTDGVSSVPAENATQNPNQAFIQAKQAEIMKNPELMNDLMGLAQDPEFLKLLQDPELMQSIKNNDIERIQANPKMQQLIDNPKMKILMEKALPPIPQP